MKKDKPIFCITMKIGEINIVELEIELDRLNTLIKNDQEDKKLYFSRGTIKMKMCDFQGAITDYIRVIELDPNAPFVYLYKGYAEMFCGNIIGSIDDFDKATRLDQRCIEAWYSKGTEK